MSDGSRLRQSWYSSLNDAEANFRQLLTSPSSDWRRISSAGEASASKKGKARTSAVPELSDVIVHRSGEDVFRIILDIPATEELASLEPWKAVLTAPELRQEWDPAVEEAHHLETFDRSTRITKTNFSLGWPANPRDAVTISRSFDDTTTVLDISTSLPRSVDEPAYLRPSPPYVRSHVHLFAWCIQHLQNKIRVTCFWQHDFQAMWGLGSSSSTLAQQLSTMVLSLFKTVMKRGGRIPRLIGYGNGVSIERLRFQPDREAFTIDYAIIPDEDTPADHDIDVIREHRRLTRSIECILPSMEGWEVQVSLKASSEEVEQLPWSSHALKAKSTPSAPYQILLRLSHSALLDDHSVLKVKVVIEASGGTRGLRLNGLPKTVHDTEQRDPSSFRIPEPMLQDIASAVDLSVQTASSMSSVSSSLSINKPLERTSVADKSILSRIRRNYIYFSSLLQEPEAKWRRTTDGRGVAITQLDSIDPTLVVYRAEATFVGVGLWDLYGTLVSPGARIYWDKQHDDAVLLEDVNELSELWYFKSKPAWPVHGRDSVVLKTVYKSPNVIHVFSFSVDDPHLFSNIPPADPNTIRTQVDLQGWSIEALSPNTTSLTLLEQSDPKGWTNKTSIPTYMINTLAGIGEFAIKCGGPPIVTRMTGAKANEMRYDHEKGTFRVEYEASSARRRNTFEAGGSVQEDSNQPSIECEIRCDVDTWASSLDIVVDPPPQTMTCLRRHRLSNDGGGLWLTLTHDCSFVDDERLLVLIRRAPGKEKGLVMVNGAKIQVDVEEIPKHELEALSKQKRVKPPRVPLDQPPVLSVVKRKRSEWSHENASDEASSSAGWASAPRISSPLSRFWSDAVDLATSTTQQYVAAITPANSTGSSSTPSATKLPVQYGLEALAWTQDFHKSAAFQSMSATDGWSIVAEKGVTVLRKSIPEVSPIIPVHKGAKVIEGASAEELASVIMDDNCRKTWDDRFDSTRTLEAYGNSCRTQFLTSKAGFPFRDRGFYLASVVARTQPASSSPGSSVLSQRTESDNGDQNKSALFIVSASFSAESVTPLFAASKYNFYALPVGRMYLDAWVLETLDPYSTEKYAIPSTRCTRLVAVDYAGSIPAAVNTMINVGLPRAILAVENCFKTLSSSLPMTRLPAPCMVIAEKKGEDRLATVSWKLKRRDQNRLLVQESYVPEIKTYRVSLMVSLAPSTSSNHNEHPPNSVSAPNSSRSSTSPTPRSPRTRASLGPSFHGRAGSEATISPSAMSLSGSRSRSSSTSSMHRTLASSSSTETLRSTQSQETVSQPQHYNAIPASVSASPTIPYGSPASTLLRPFRQRSASSTDGRVIHGQFSTSPSVEGVGMRPGTASLTSSPQHLGLHSHMRGRVASAFTAKGEIRPLTDLVVGEMVVDARMYPDGYYVVVRSRRIKRPRTGSQEREGRSDELSLVVDGKDKGKGREGTRKEMFLKMGSLHVLPSVAAAPMERTSSSDSTSSAGSTSSLDTVASSKSSLPDIDDDDHFLPLVYSIYTMPAAPLHSSSLNPETGATRHLLRLTLPTAQFWESSIRDPLTGEIRNGPKKPHWMKVLEGTSEGDGVQGDEEKGEDEGVRLRGAIVDLEIRPVEVVHKGKNKSKSDGSDKKRKRVKKVNVNGALVNVLGEKESLSMLGRAGLLDERIANMGVLVPNETEALPEELIVPVAVANDIVDPAVWNEGGASTDAASTNTAGATAKPGDSGSPHSGGGTSGTKAGEKSSCENTPGTPADGLASSITSTSVGSESSNGLWALWSSYRFPFGGSAPTIAGDSAGNAASDDDAAPRKLDGETGDDGGEGVNTGGDSTQIEDQGEPKGEAAIETQEQQVLPTQTRPAKVYPLSTVLIVALIAFLIGSLLRSLLSPADFIHVVEADEANKVMLAEDAGWREIKRLFELKYVLGGWDFQVAAVRRHPV